jgi:UDP-2,3-diacylglucosamine pyrophosphatase LpxH
MAQKAETHHILLSIDPQTRIVKDYPPKTLINPGCSFDAKLCQGSFDISRQNQQSSRQSTIKKKPLRFVYLDVGVWAGNERWFGLICGSRIWLCKFIYGQVQNVIPSEVWGEKRLSPLYEFWGAFADTNANGFEVHSYTEVIENPPSEDMLYVILPDMHLPAVPYYDKPKSKTVHRTDDGRIIVETYWDGNAADIFLKGAEDTGEALSSFLDTVVTLGMGVLDQKLKILQVGDMYEMWQGMGVSDHFETTGSPNKSLIVKKDSVPSLYSRIKGIEDRNKKLFLRFNLVMPNMVHYLYGNHDVYLCEKLRTQNKIVWPKKNHYECWVKRPSKAISAKIYNGGIIGIYKDQADAESEKGDDNVWKNDKDGMYECWIKKYSRAINAFTFVHQDGANGIIGIYKSEIDALVDNDDWTGILGERVPRKTYFMENNIFAEHGHRMDKSNQDGYWLGPFITEMVYYLPGLRAFDELVWDRENYHRLSAIELYYRWLLKQPPFSVFVMGHTHKPELMVMEIYRKPGQVPGSLCRECSKKKRIDYPT